MVTVKDDKGHPPSPCWATLLPWRLLPFTSALAWVSRLQMGQGLLGFQYDRVFSLKAMLSRWDANGGDEWLARPLPHMPGKQAAMSPSRRQSISSEGRMSGYHGNGQGLNACGCWSRTYTTRCCDGGTLFRKRIPCKSAGSSCLSTTDSNSSFNRGLRREAGVGIWQAFVSIS